MRRMLDPTKVGEINLYCHRIKLTNMPNNWITLNYFNTSDVPFTRSSFQTKIVDHHLPCSGAISIIRGTKVKYIPTYLYINESKGISCIVVDFDTNNYNFVNLDTYKFYDDVVPA